MIQQAIILAGGFGTRLQTVVSDVPKPMAPINGRPFLEYVLDHCLLHQIHRVVLAVGYKHEVIQAHFGNNYQGIELLYSIEKEALGTGGGILQAAQMMDKKPFFVLNGDTLFKVPLQELGTFHQQHQADMTLALCVMEDFDRYGIVQLDEAQRVSSFIEKRYQKQGDINAGVYVLNLDILNQSNLPQKFSFEKDFMEAFVHQYQFYGMATANYFIDIGIPEDYAKAQKDL